MLLTGEGGVGKSAFLAELVNNPKWHVERRVVATHFCDAQADESLLPEIFAPGSSCR